MQEIENQGEPTLSEKIAAMVVKDPTTEKMKRDAIAKAADLCVKISAHVVKDEETAEQAKELQKACTAFVKDVEEARTSITGPINELVKSMIAEERTLTAPALKAKEEIQAKQLAYAQEVEKRRMAEENRILSIIAKANSFRDELEFEMYAMETESEKDPRIALAIQQRRNSFSEEKRQADERKRLEEERKRLEEVAKQQGEEAARIAREQAEEREMARQADAEAARVREDIAQRELSAQTDLAAKVASKASTTGGVKGIRTTRKFEVTNASLVPREFLSPDETKIREAVKTLSVIPGVRIWEAQTVC